MRRRIAMLLLPLLALLATGIVVFAGVLVSDRATQAVYVDRLGDATRFAAMVSEGVETGDLTRLTADLAAYSDLYASPVWVIALDGGLLHDPQVGLPENDDVREAVERARAGVRASETAAVWPWSHGPIHVVEPVGRDSQVIAVVVIQAPTERLAARIWRNWTLVSLVLLVPVAGLIAGLWPVTTWLLRPVQDLEDVAVRVSAGDLETRADADHGPPELRQLAGAFNTMVTAVQRSLRRQRDFVADAAHQLRNPLASLQLTVESMSPWVSGTEAQEAYDDAVAESRRMSQMFEAMLHATALTGAGPVHDDDAAPLAQILQAGTERWRHVLEDVGMQVQIDPVPPDLVLREPAGGLASVLDELIENAARLSQGTRVRIAAHAVGPDRAEVMVSDDGVGLSPEERAAALGRFWRADRHQNTPGTGLGLAILADLTVDAGGRLNLRENDGGGLQVAVELPVVAQSLTERK